MTTTDQIDSNDEWPDAIGPERKEDSGLRPADGHGINTEEPHHNPEKADLGGGINPLEARSGRRSSPLNLDRQTRVDYFCLSRQSWHSPF